MVDLTVVIPLYKGRSNISPLLAELEPQLEESELEWEILFVDDGSPDDGFDIVRGLNETDCRIRGIRLIENRGQQNAVYCGICHAGGKLIITMDDDLQHPPHLVSRLIEESRKGFDLVYAVNRSRNRPFLLRAGTCLNGLFFSFFLNKPFSLEIGSYRIMTGALADRIKGEKGRFVYVSALFFRLSPPPRTASFRYEPPAGQSDRGSRFLPGSRIRLFLRLFLSYGPFGRIISRRGEPYAAGELL